MNQQEAEQLLQRYIDGRCSNEEKLKIEEWYSGLQNEFRWELTADDQSNVYNRMKTVIENNTGLGLPRSTSTGRMRRMITWQRVAAAVIVTVMITGAFWLINRKPAAEIADTQKKSQHRDIPAPASTAAYITLADGTRVLLDSIGKGSVAKQGNITITKLSDGKIAYGASKAGAELVYNTLTVPRGSRIVELTLSDGSLVALNAESSLKYPVVFDAKQRPVTISGEAYFEVTKDAKKPFTVEAKGTKITVLGTSFNVNAYTEEAVTKTTLLEGRIQLTKAAESIILSPGQQAEADEKIKVTNDIDVDAVMAWRNGWFDFNSMDLSSIMRQVGRWYDMEVVYASKPGNETFSGIVSRSSNLSEVLKIMEQTGVRFTIQDKKIIVKP